MEILIIWAIGSLLVGWMGDNTTLGFGSAFLISAIFSPVIGFIIVLLYPSKASREKQMAEQRKQTEILQSMSAGKLSIADEIEKLKKQHDAGVLTDDEFQQMKTKLIAKL